jgi:branched-chain amino acid transport system substrate-binding protein
MPLLSKDEQFMKRCGGWLAATLVAAMVATAAEAASAQKKYDSGASDAEIKIGTIMPFAGPAAAYAIIGHTIAAYFKKINAEGGVNGRKLNLIAYDDSYNPAKTLQQARRLVEDEQVLLIFASLGTQTNAAIRDYMNTRKVPQLFVASGASMWDNPKDFPWTMGFQPSYQTEAHIYAQYLIDNHPNGKVAVLYQNDDFGKDYLKGLEDGLDGKLPIVARVPYALTDTSLIPQITRLHSSGADILFDVTTPKFAVEAIRRVAQIGWHPEHIITSVSESVGAVLKPAGVENAEGLLSAYFVKEPNDPSWKNDAEFAAWRNFMATYLPDADLTNTLTVYGYVTAQALIQVLKQCGDDLTRENVMKQAASLKGFRLGMLLPGIAIDTSAADFAPLEQMSMMRFTGGQWKRFGSVLNGIDPGAVSEGFKAIFKYGTATRETAGQQNANTVTMMTGTFDGTYVQIGADLASVLDDGRNFRLLPVVGRGSVQAVADILFLKGVDVGIVRTDTLDYLEKKGYANNIKGQLGYITKLYNEEMHVLAPKTIRDLQDLDGKTVAVDLPDGGTFVTAMTVFERLGIKPHFLYIEPRVALEKLRQGEIDAMIAVEGKPIDLLQQLDDQDLHLVPVDYVEPLQTDYLPAQFTSDDYPHLVAKGTRVDTIAAAAVLVAYNWPPASDRYRRLSLLVDALFGKIKELQKPPYHPKWKEVTQHATLAGWTRFRPAQEWLDKNAVATTTSVETDDRLARLLRESQTSGANAAPATSNQLLAQFHQFLSERGSAASKLGPERLMRDFLEWQGARQVTR